MQENATIDKSWDFLVNADEIDVRKMKSASQFFMFFRFNSSQDTVIRGKDLVEDILTYSYNKTDEPITFNQFLQDIAYAFGLNESENHTIEETELALLQKFEDDIMREATDDEKEKIGLYKLFSSHEDEGNIKDAINTNIERVSKLLDIDIFSNDADNLFYNDHPLVERCYRAVVYKHYSFFRLNKLFWKLRLIDLEKNSTKIALTLFAVLVVALFLWNVILRIIFVILLLAVLLTGWRLNVSQKKERKEFKQNSHSNHPLKAFNIRSLIIPITTLIYLRQNFSNSLEKCIAKIEGRYKTFNKEFIAMALIHKLYSKQRDKEIGGNMPRVFTTSLLLEAISEKIETTDFEIITLSQNLKQALDYLYNNIDPDRNQYYEDIQVTAEPNQRLLLVDYRFPYTEIKTNTKFLKHEKNDIYDELNRIYIYLMGYDLDEIMIDPKPGDEFDIIQVFDSDRMEHYKPFLSENGKFVVVRTKEDIDRSTFLTTASDIRHMLGTPFSNQGVLIRRIRRYLEKGQIQEYQTSVDSLISNTEYIRRVISSYRGDIELLFKNGVKKADSFNILSELNSYAKNYKAYGNSCFRIQINHEELPHDTNIRINKDHLFSALDTILENAARHGFKGREDNPDNCVEISLGKVVVGSKDMLQVSVKNNGKPSSVTIDQYIKRGRKFTETGNTGLGGYLIDIFARANGGFIDLERNEKWGFIINMYLLLDNQII